MCKMHIMNSPASRISFLQRLLRPVVRVCLSYGFSIQEVTEAAKAAFVAIAKSEMEKRGERCNVSRLSVMSGLHRRDVLRLLDEAPAVDSSVGMMSRIIGQWCHDKRFCSAPGNPRPLTHQHGGEDFTQLVRSVSQDLHPGTVMFELRRRDLVEQSEQGVCLKVGALDSREDHLEGLQMLAEDVDDLSSAVLKNLDSPTPLNLHSKTEFDRIPVKKIPEVRSWLLQHGAGWQRETREYLASIDLDISGNGEQEECVRVACGVFSVVDESSSATIGEGSRS